MGPHNARSCGEEFQLRLVATQAETVGCIQSQAVIIAVRTRGQTSDWVPVPRMIEGCSIVDRQLDESLVSLEKSTKYLLNTAKQYKYQVDFLRKEIENLEIINNSLERKCFKNTFAKPEL